MSIQHYTSSSPCQAPLSSPQTPASLDRQIILAPSNTILHLPNEIFCSIFHVLREDDPQIYSFPALSSGLRHGEGMSAIVTISAVCRRWRQIALSTPGLWSSFYIDLAMWKNGSGLAHIVQMYMDRSRTMPLKFVLSWDRYISHVGDPAMQILASNSFRWLEVHFPSDDTAPNPGVMVRIKGRLPLLRCLEIGTELGRQDLFEDAPALISIGGTPDPDWQLPYDQLTKLNLNYCQGDVAIPILQRCTNVQHAELDNIIDWEGQDRVTMPNMRSMVITASNDEEVIFTCNQLRLPQLDFLVLQNDVYVTREPPLDEAGYDILIERFFTDCSCITTFKMKGLRVSDLQLIRILASLPQLRKLSIRNLVWYVPNAQSYSLQPSNRTISSQFIQRLTVKQDAEELVIVPKLTELTLASLPRDFDARSFVDMIFSRWRPRNGGPATFDDDCLCTVKVGLKFKDDSDVAQEFSRLEPLQRLGFGFNAYEKI